MAISDETIQQVDQFTSLAMTLTEAAAAYAGEVYSDPDMNALLAKVQVIAASLQTALQQATQRAASRPFPPPEPEPPEPESKPINPAKKGR